MRERKNLSTEVALAEHYEIFSRKFETAKPKDKIDFEWSQQQTHAHVQQTHMMANRSRRTNFG